MDDATLLITARPKWTDASRAIAADIASTILQLEWQELQDSIAGEMVLYLAERSTPNRLPW